MRRTKGSIYGASFLLGLAAACTGAADDVSDEVSGVAEPPDAAGPPIGANCGEDYECEPLACVDYLCAPYCDPNDAHACRDFRGMCVHHRGHRYACEGDLDTGDDRDEAVLHHGDSVVRELTPANDLDVYRLDVGAGDCHVDVRPDPFVDVELDFYDARGLQLAGFDDALAGGAEGATWNNPDPAGGYVIVRGGATGGVGTYEIEVRR